MLIGLSLIETGFQNWAGGSGLCKDRPSGFFSLCPDTSAPHALPWGSAQFIGLGFSVFVTIILCERFGSPIMQSTNVVFGLLVGCIIAAATGYFDRSGIDAVSRQNPWKFIFFGWAIDKSIGSCCVLYLG